MRPKIVVLTLLSGLAALLLIGLISGWLGKPASEAVAPEPGGENGKAKPVPGVAVTNVLEPTIVASTPEEDRAAHKQKDLDAISDALIQGDDDPNSLFAVEARLDNPDPEVRKAALEAAVHLGNTNIIPRMLVVIQQLEDPREKVAFLDALEYLQLPSGNDIPKGGLGAPKAPKLAPRAKPNPRTQPPPAGAANGAAAGEPVTAAGNASQ